MIINSKFSIKNLFASFYVINIIFLFSFLGLGQLATIVFIPLGLSYICLFKSSKLKYALSQKAIKWHLLFCFFTSISIFYAIDSQVAFETQKKLLIVSIFSLIVFSLAVTSARYIHIIYVTNVIILLFLFLYVFSLGSASGVGRIDNSNLNANTYGYYIFNGLYSLFMIGSGILFKKKYKVINTFFLLAVCILSLWLILLTASRGAFIITVLLISGNIFIIFSLSKTSIAKKTLFLILTSISLFFSFDYFYENYFYDSYLFKRFQILEDVETPREQLFYSAIEIGVSNPILGVGSGNFAKIQKTKDAGSFSHNTFTEIFANYGLLGLILYAIFHFVIFYKLKRLFEKSNYHTKIILQQILLFLILFNFYSAFYVVYLTTAFMHLLFVIYAHILTLEKFIFRK